MKTVKFKFSNGEPVEDKISGITGIVSASAIWLNGCIQYSIQPKANLGENKIPESWWIDEAQLIKIGRKIDVEQKNDGGPSKRSPRL